MGFFKKLVRDLSVMIQYKLPQGIKEQENFDLYARKWIDTTDKFIETFNWIDFFERCTYIDESDPQILSETFKGEDKEGNFEYKTLADFDLKNIHIVLCSALKQYINEDLESDPITEKLHQYYLMTKNEINSRSTMPKLPQIDAYHDYLTHKKKYIEEQNLMEIARQEGKICPYCKSTKIKSDGHSWRCKVCKKYWRKH